MLNIYFPQTCLSADRVTKHTKKLLRDLRVFVKYSFFSYDELQLMKKTQFKSYLF